MVGVSYWQTLLASAVGGLVTGVLAIVGVVMYQAMRIIERRFLFWSGDHMRAIGS